MLALLSAVLGASLLLPPPGRDGRIGHLPDICPFYLLTGLPCPGCGLTRAFVCLGHGQFHESLHWHPIGWLLYGLCALLWLRAALTLARGRPVLALSPRTSGRLSALGAMAVLVTGVIRILWLTAHHQSF